MNQRVVIKIKAALLLIVFSLNTIIGFACAMGADMGFNSKHHHDKKEATRTVVHVHANGKKHQHSAKEGPEKDGCCNDGVVRFQNLDKSLNQNIVTALNASFLTALISNYFGIAVPESITVGTNRQILQFFHPPPPDIRILIQSFQI